MEWNSAFFANTVLARFGCPTCLFRGTQRDCRQSRLLPPSFNQGNFISGTINSVLAQDYPHLEYGVTDGGSTDGTREVILQYRDRLAYYVSEADEGQSHAIAKGFSNLKGEIMAYLNSDDLLMPGTLRFVCGFFAEHPEIDVIYGHRIVIDEAGREVGRWVLPRHDAKAIRHFDYVPRKRCFGRGPLRGRLWN
jgi:glycosyltransferase involved in cell wall biosynthesis